MEVPSVVVPEETNVLVNPRHADAFHVSASKLRAGATTDECGTERPVLSGPT